MEYLIDGATSRHNDAQRAWTAAEARLNAQHSHVQGAVDAFVARIGALENALASAQARINALEQPVAAAAARIDALEQPVAAGPTTFYSHRSHAVEQAAAGSHAASSNDAAATTVSTSTALVAAAGPVWAPEPHPVQGHNCDHDRAYFTIAIDDELLAFSVSASDAMPNEEVDELWAMCNSIGSLWDMDATELWKHLRARPALRIEMHNPKQKSQAYYVRMACENCGKATDKFMPQRSRELEGKAKSSEEVKAAYRQCIEHNLIMPIKRARCRHRAGAPPQPAPCPNIGTYLQQQPPPPPVHGGPPAGATANEID